MRFDADSTYTLSLWVKALNEGYTGSIRVKLYNLGNKQYTVNQGDKIAQLIISRYETPKLEIVEHLDETARGDNGFGSTGR